MKNKNHTSSLKSTLLSRENQGGSKRIYAGVFSLCLLLGASGRAYGDVNPNGEIITGDPLIAGASWTPRCVAPPQGPPPALGSGLIPLGTPVGETCPPTTDPWVTTIPVNTAGITDSDPNVPAPYTPNYIEQPGQLGSELASYIPKAPSTPGSDPGILQTPAGYSAPAVSVDVNTNGGLPNGSAPIARRGGQDTADFGLSRNNGALTVDFGLSVSKNPAVTKTVAHSQDGPLETPNQPTASNSAYMTYLPNFPNAQSSAKAQSTTDLYGVRTLFRGSTRAQQINALF